MMNDTGWRRLVTWNKERKEYEYKGHSILPLSYREQIETPMHLQAQYYWGEIMWIDKIVEQENRDRENKEVQPINTVDEAINQLFSFWES